MNKNDDPPNFGKNFKFDEVMKVMEPYLLEDRCYGGIMGFKAPYSVIKSLANANLVYLDEAQNSSPTIGEFLSRLAEIGENVQFIGYIVEKKRPDTRLSIEGFVVNGLSARKLNSVKDEFSNADESFAYGNDQWRFWWD